jgi:superfamily II DNA or RNA helicase
MNTLKLQNQYSWLSSDDEGLKDLLWEHLRFRPKNYFHNSAYRQRKWDGYNDYFKRDSGRFLTGLLPEVKLALAFKKQEYEVIDERGTYDFATHEITPDFLNQWKPKSWDPVTLHDYQVEYIQQASRHHRGLIVAPTGAGKTFIMVGLLKCLPPNTPTLVMTKSVDLVRQIYDDLSKWDFPKLGRVIGGKKPVCEPNLITVANVDSIHRIEKLLPHFRALIVDEVHVMMSKVPTTVYRKMKNSYVRFGLSATPFKFNGADKCQRYETKGFFGAVIRPSGGQLTTKELQDRKILAGSKCIFYPINEPELPYHTYQDATTEGIAESLHFNEIVAKLAKKCKGRTLIIVERVRQGEILNQLIKGSHWVYGKDNEAARDKVKALLQKGDNSVCIVQQALISAGINVFIHNLINAMGGKADHHIIQRMGRGLRTADDKEDLTYHDFIFHVNDYLLDHSHHRVKVLKREGHNIVVKDEVDF